MKNLMKKIGVIMCVLCAFVGTLVCVKIYSKADEINANNERQEYSEETIIHKAEEAYNALVSKDADNFVGILDEGIKKQISEGNNLKNDEEIMLYVYNCVFSEGISNNLEYINLIENVNDSIEIAFGVKDKNKYYQWIIKFNKILKIKSFYLDKTIPIAKETEYSKEYNIKVGEYQLEGILSLPKGVDRPSVAIIVPGSGYADADCGEFYRDIANDLGEKGIASLRFNERFYEKYYLSRTNNTLYTESIDDVCAAVDMLKEDDRVSSKNIFIIGQSLGGIMAPKIAELKPEVSGIISLAGSPRKLVDIVADQYKMACDESNATDEDRKLIEKVIYDIRNISTENDDMSGAEITDTMTDVETEKMNTYRTLRMYSDTYWLSCHKLNTEEILKELNIPMLILQGEKDVNIHADKDYVEWQRLLAGRDNCHFKLYPGLNHAFRKQVYAGFLNAEKDYALPGRIEKTVTNDMAEFIHTYTVK